MTVTIESASQGDHHFVEITIDDGLLNVLDLAAVSSIGEGFDLAVAAGHPVVLAGRSGAFTAGLDLKVLRTGGEAAAELLDAMAAVLVQAVELPVPLVAAVNGPAIAAGAMLCLAADHVVMAAGDHQIGFSEVRQGLALPGPAVELAHCCPRRRTQSRTRRSPPRRWASSTRSSHHPTSCRPLERPRLGWARCRARPTPRPSSWSGRRCWPACGPHSGADRLSARVREKNVGAELAARPRRMIPPQESFLTICDAGHPGKHERQKGQSSMVTTLVAPPFTTTVRQTAFGAVSAQTTCTPLSMNVHSPH